MNYSILYSGWSINTITFVIVLNVQGSKDLICNLMVMIYFNN